MPDTLTRWLERSSPGRFSAFAISAAFTAYFSMYAFRKPFAAATFEGLSVGAIDLKIALVTSQVCGYALAKFLSIKFVSELNATRRVTALITLIAIAEAALFAFALLPPPGKVAAIFCNGLSLGAVWGLVFAFLEGRRTSELLGAGLSTSYIVASGAVKSVGRGLMDLGISASWMPAVTGALFFLPFLLAVWGLKQLPPPTDADQKVRSPRAPMHREQRRAFWRRFALGLTALTALYTLLTAYRDFRDNFAAELWAELGWADSPGMFTYAEVPIAVAVMAALALIYRIHDNRRALHTIHGLMLAGSALIGLSTVAFELGLIGGVSWMILSGGGLYLGYVPYGCVLFDRIIAATGTVGTAVFMIYVTDAFGYVGSIVVLAIKHAAGAHISWLRFFVGFSYLTALVCTAGFIVSAAYFSRRSRPAP